MSGVRDSFFLCPRTAQPVNQVMAFESLFGECPKKSQMNPSATSAAVWPMMTRLITSVLNVRQSSLKVRMNGEIDSFGTALTG